MRSITLPLSFVAVAALAVGGCGGDAKNAVNVVATASSCEPATTNLPAGKTTFKVQNKGNDVTEMYVLQGTRTVGEVENIGPGTSRNLTANLKAGDYELVCKPGMKGDGIRTKITVTGSGGQSLAPARKVDVDARDFSYSGLEGFSAKAGEKVEFVLHNTGAQEHELEILAADGTSPGEVGQVKPGQSGEAEITLPKAGTYTYRCGLVDHEQMGMKGTFTVSA